MGGHTTMKRDGGWTIELITPLAGNVTQLDIKLPTLDHTIRWTRNEIPSVLALLAELCGVKETHLKQLAGVDSDRVLMAFSILVPPQIRDDFQNERRPLSTPFESLTPEQQYDVVADDNDPDDPRFPRITGDYMPFVDKTQQQQQPEQRPEQQPEQRPEQQPDRGGMDLSPPEVMRRVG